MMNNDWAPEVELTDPGVPETGDQFCGHPDCKGHGPDGAETVFTFTADHTGSLRLNAGVSYRDR